MKNKRKLLVPLFQLIIGLLAIAAFFVVGLGGEDMAKWIITLVLARPHAEVFCSNTDKAAATKAVCSAGCLGCKMCAKVCPSDAITFDGGRAVISAEKCISCGKCQKSCPQNIDIARHLMFIRL